MGRAKFAALALVLILAGCSQAEQVTVEKPTFGNVSDLVAPKVEDRAAEIIAEIEAQEEPQEEIYEPYYEPNEFYYFDGAYYNADVYEVPSDGLTPEGGVNYHDGRTETYYSSNVLYHYNTAAWTVDDEGFYRTDEGYYVVAASDMEQGTVFEGSKGECIVLDSGCAEGVTDYYVAW